MTVLWLSPPWLFSQTALMNLWRTRRPGASPAGAGSSGVAATTPEP